MINSKTLKSGVILKERYRIESKINHGGMGQTYKAVDLTDENTVAIKMLLFSQMTEWKTLDLFEREVNTLQNLNYPFIPDYIDDFKIEGKSDIAYFLVQEFVEGKNLFELVEAQKCFETKEILEIFKSLLKTLDYIHNLNPAVIHRDIQPKNIVMKDSNPYLLDFGSVGQIVMDTMLAGNTFIGTIGYFPHELMMGKVSPSSDLYALAMTMIFLLTGKHPVDLESLRGKFEYRKFTVFDEKYCKILDKMTEVFPEDRFQSANEVMAKLDKLNKTIETVEIKPPTGERKDISNPIQEKSAFYGNSQEKTEKFIPEIPSEEEIWQEEVKEKLFKSWMNDEGEPYRLKSNADHSRKYKGSIEEWEKEVKSSLFDDWFQREYDSLDPQRHTVNAFSVLLVTTIIFMLISIENTFLILPIGIIFTSFALYFGWRYEYKIEREFQETLTNFEQKTSTDEEIKIKRFKFWLEREKKNLNNNYD